MTNKPEQLPSEKIEILIEDLRDSLIARPFFQHPSATFIEKTNLTITALVELQERRKADSAEPVSFDELNAAVAEVTGGNQHAWDANIYKGHQAVPFMNYNSLARIVDKYRTPPAR